MKAKKQERVRRKFICDYIVRLDHSPEAKRHKSPLGAGMDPHLPLS
jgi:hypothetical protein